MFSDMFESLNSVVRK